jgi:uncharacterized protein with HEPN domain
MSKKDRGCLLAMLDSIEKILEYVRDIASARDYFRSGMAFDATLMNFINIGEMTDRVSEDLKALHPEIDWQLMKDFRNLVAHDYLGVDAEEVWQIIKNDLPTLKNAIKKMLSSVAFD